MKLSNRILIGFFAIIFIYMTVAFTEIRFRGHLNHIDDTNSKAESVDIKEMNYLVVMPGMDNQITIIGANMPRIEVRSLEGNLLQKLKYTLKADTLILKDFDIEEKQRVRISVYAPEGTFRGITVNNGDLIIKSLKMNTLEIHQTNGRVHVHEDNNFQKLTIEATQSANFTYMGSRLDTLSAQIDDSRIVILSPINRIEGAMSNDSYLHVKKVHDIAFKKDESSELRLF